MVAGVSIASPRTQQIARVVGLAGLLGLTFGPVMPPPTMASCPYPVQAELHGEYWTDYTIPIPVPFRIPLVTIDVCQPSFEIGKFGASVTIGNTNNGISADFNFDLQGAVFDLIPLIDAGFASPDSIVSGSLQCTVSLRDTMAHVNGSGNTYAFHVGGGGPFGQRIWGTVRMCDRLIIESSGPVALELPVHISASVVTAESFGDPNQTYGIARVCLSGSAGGISITDACLEDTSVSVIPTPRSLDVSRVVPIAAAAGQTIVPIAVVAEIESKSQAKSIGLFGIISGAATAGVSLPGLFLGNIRGAGGTPLPEGVLIRSDSTGFVYADTRPAGVPPSRWPSAAALNLANPYRVGSPITLERLAPGARARVVDLAGRRVRDLGTAGDRPVWGWDGRDDSGGTVGSGMYYLVASWPEGSARRAFVLMR